MKAGIGGPEPIPAVIRWEAGYTLVRLTVYRRANTVRCTSIHTHIHDLESSVNLKWVSWSEINQIALVRLKWADDLQVLKISQTDQNLTGSPAIANQFSH